MNAVTLLLTEEAKGCLMVHLPLADAVKIIQWSEENIPDEALAEDGRERDCHVTIAYGFTEDVTATEVFDTVQELHGDKPLVFQLGDVSRFENEEHDVLKVEVMSPDLEDLHHGLKAKFKDRLEVTFDQYQAHLTLAYVKKGSLKNLDGCGPFNGELYLGRDLVYSTAERRKTEHTLGVTDVDRLLST